MATMSDEALTLAMSSSTMPTRTALGTYAGGVDAVRQAGRVPSQVGHRGLEREAVGHPPDVGDRGPHGVDVAVDAGDLVDPSGEVLDQRLQHAHDRVGLPRRCGP